MQIPTPARSIWVRIFVSPDEPRLRAGWRLAIQTVLMLILFICTTIPLVILSQFAGTSEDGLVLLTSVIELIAITLSIFLARRFLDRRSFGSLGLKLDRWTLFDLLAGIAITLLMMGGIFLAMHLLGWIRVGGFTWQAEPPGTVLGRGLLILFGFVLVGWNEELLSRGYHLQTLASGLNLYWGVVLSSLIFGILHMLNPSASWVSTLGIVLAGLFLACGYLGTRQLWLPIGLHIGWNFFEGPVFGFSGPDLWTGGPFGPEAGLIVLPALALGVLLVYAYSRARRRLNPGKAVTEPGRPA